MWSLFIFGTYNCDDTPLIRDIYPYIIFLWLNILEKKAMHFLQEKQKIQIEKDFQIISIKRPSGKLHTLKLSNEFEKQEILKSLDKVCKISATPRAKASKLLQKGSLPIEAFKFGEPNTQQKEHPSKSLDVAQMKSIKNTIHPLTLELEGVFPEKTIQNLIKPMEEEEEKDEKMSFFDERKIIPEISHKNEEFEISLTVSSLSKVKNDLHFMPKEKAMNVNSTDLMHRNAYKLQNFYKNKKAYLKYEIILGSQYFLIRIFLIIFLVNSDITNSIFAILYLVIVLVICFRRNRYIIDFIKDFTLAIIPVHYLCFLININSETSPRFIPSSVSSVQDVSLVLYIFGDTGTYNDYAKWLKFIGIGLDTSDFTSFILVSLIICFMQIYFMYYFGLVEYIIRSIDKRYEKYEKALEEKECGLINYRKWKRPEYRFVNQFYNFLHYGIHLVIIFFLCFFTIIDFSLPNFVLFLLFMIYVVICELGFRWPYSFEKLFFIKAYFRVIQIFEIFFLFLIHIFYIPEVSDICTFSWCMEINTYMSIYDKLISLLVLQLGIDLISYNKYAEVCYFQCSKKMLRVYFFSLCFTINFHFNLVKTGWFMHNL